MSAPQSRLKERSAWQAEASRDATPPRSVHAQAGGHGAAELGPLGGTARTAKEVQPRAAAPPQGANCAPLRGQRNAGMANAVANAAVSVGVHR